MITRKSLSGSRSLLPERLSCFWESQRISCSMSKNSSESKKSFRNISSPSHNIFIKLIDFFSGRIKHRINRRWRYTGKASEMIIGNLPFRTYGFESFYYTLFYHVMPIRLFFFKKNSKRNFK